MKSSTELQQEITLLEQELASTLQLANSVSAKSYLLQSVTAGVVLGTYGQQALSEAQSSLDAAVEAVTRTDMLRRSIADLRSQLSYTEGQERAAYCRSVAVEFQTVYDQFLEDCKTCLNDYKSLQALSTKYQGLTGRTLLDRYQHNLHLPALHGPSDHMGAAMPTGSR